MAGNWLATHFSGCQQAGALFYAKVWAANRLATGCQLAGEMQTLIFFQDTGWLLAGHI